MANKSIENEHASFTFRHRAICEDDNFKSPWVGDIELARQAALAHWDIPGNETHTVRVVTEQTISMVFRKP